MMSLRCLRILNQYHLIIMKLNLIVVVLFGALQSLGAQNLQKLTFSPVKEAPIMIEREKAETSAE